MTRKLIVLLSLALCFVSVEALAPVDPSTLRQGQGRPEHRRGTTGSGSPRASSRGDSLTLAQGRPETPQSNMPVVGRSMVASRYGIVAASQPLAARAGVQILERGGNVVDAIIAANATIGLMEPTGNGIGGDLFAIVYEAKTGKVYGLNASGWAPTGLTPAFLASKGHKEMPQRGIYSVTVPGAVAGWDALRNKFGTKPFSELLAPAIFHADNGFPLSEVIAGGWGRSAKMLAEHPNSRKTYLIDGRAPRAGEVFRNPDLAGSLRLIAEKGRDGYYKSRTAEAIVQISRENAGTMTLADLAEFQPEWVTPIETTYRGWTVYEIPPNGQGIAALMMLNVMEQFPLREYGFHSAKSLHAMIEAKKLAYADLLQYVGDPKFSSVPVVAMLNKAHAGDRAKLIDPAKARCAVDPSRFPGITDAQGSDTIYMTAVDKDGNIVSLIQSNYSGFGSGLVPAGTGFMLQNRGGLFTLEANRPNTLAPRKRPLHTIIPAFMQKDGVRIGFGIMGGWNQSQAHAQFVANIADYGMTIQQALEAGRFTKGSFSGCDVEIESLVPEGTRAELTSRGHELRVIGPRTGTFGYGQAVMSTPDGVHFGASEPRHDGAAIPEAPPVFGAVDPSSDLLAAIDHLVYASPNVQAGIDKIEQLLGVRATPGGQHPGRGTRNALIALGPTSYLEIIGPDPEQPHPAQPRPFGIDELTEPRLVAWAAKGKDLEKLAADASRRGVKLGNVTSGSRKRTDGLLLSWRYTDPRTVVARGVVPFFIDWGSTPHPSATAAPGASLIALRAEHPDADQLQKSLRDLGLSLRIERAPTAALIATIKTARGQVELR